MHEVIAEIIKAGGVASAASLLTLLASNRHVRKMSSQTSTDARQLESMRLKHASASSMYADRRDAALELVRVADSEVQYVNRHIWNLGHGPSEEEPWYDCPALATACSRVELLGSPDVVTAAHALQQATQGFYEETCSQDEFNKARDAFLTSVRAMILTDARTPIEATSSEGRTAE